MAAVAGTGLEAYGKGKIKPQATAVLLPQASPEPGLGCHIAENRIESPRARTF